MTRIKLLPLLCGYITHHNLQEARRFNVSNISMRITFREDQRGVSALVGAVLLLGILVIVLSSYQALIVPQQTAQTEVEHNQQVENEMVDFRNALYEARLDDRNPTASVTLGTRYQSRIIAINPPPATGTLQSIDPGNVTINHDRGEFELKNNLFFEYTPSYSEYRDAGTIRYENTLVYHDFSSSNVELSGQRLVDGNTVRLIQHEPLLDKNGVDSVTYEPTPNQSRIFRPNNVNITLPTSLGPGEWSALLDDENEWEVIDDTEGELTLNYTGDDQPEIIYSPVEDQEGLPPDDRDEDNGDEDNGPTTINPAGPDDVRLVGAEFLSDQSGEVRVSFRNFASDDAAFEQGRLPFYIRSPAQSDPPTQVTEVRVDNTLYDDEDFVDEHWTVREDFQSLSGGENDLIVLPGEETTDITFGFDDRTDSGQDFFSIEWQFETSQRSTYFIDGDGDGSPFAAEITDEQAEPETISPGEETTISAVVRDQFGDRFEGEEVTFTSDGEGGFAEGQATSDEDGEVSDVYTADEGDADEEVTVTLSAETPDVDDVTVTFDVDDGNGEENGAASFEMLSAEEFQETGNRFVTFDWDVSGTFDEVSVETDTDGPETSTERDGSETLETGSGSGREISATVTGPDGGETCTATIGNNANIDKNDFNCNSN